MKISGILLLVFILLFAGSALFLGRFVDPNKFKGRISQLVYAKTGQVLVINGKMQWSLFPWVGLKANDLTYYNPPSFTPKTFIAAKGMDIKVKLLPLITGKIEVGNVTLNHATLNLIKNKSGKFNWQALAKTEKRSSNQATEPHTNLSNFTITSLKIKNGRINWYDQQKNSRTVINSVNITSRGIQLGQPFPLEIQFHLLDDNKKQLLSLDLTSDINVSADRQQLSLGNIKIKSQLSLQKTKLNIQAQGKASTNLKNQSTLADLNYQMNDTKGQLNLIGQALNNKQIFSGTLTIDDFDPKKLIKEFDKEYELKNSEALKAASFLGKFTLNDKVIELTQFHAKIDQSDIFGNLSVSPDKKILSFNLNANQINISDYLPSDRKNDHKDSPSKDSPPSNQNSWKLKGNIKIANLLLDKLKLSDVNALVAIHSPQIKISPIHATFYKGQLDGSLSVEQQPNLTKVIIKQSLKNLDIKDLLQEFSDSEKLKGTTDITADLISTTHENTSFLAALNGKINILLKNGSFQGVDIIYQLSRAHAFIKHLPAPSDHNSKQTKFDSLAANATVTDGVINTDDLVLNSEYLKVHGKGSTNLVTKELHYRINALAQPKLASDNNQFGKEITTYQVPIKISGKISKPSFNIDFVELAKNFYSKQIQKQIVKQIDTHVLHVKDNLKEQVQNKIKELSPSKLLHHFTQEKNDTEKSAAINVEEKQ